MKYYCITYKDGTTKYFFAEDVFHALELASGYGIIKKAEPVLKGGHQ